MRAAACRAGSSASRPAVRKGERVLEAGGRPLALVDELRRELAALQPADEIRRRASQHAPSAASRPRLGVYEKPWDVAFDVMQCAQLRYGEPVRVAGKARSLLLRLVDLHRRLGAARGSLAAAEPRARRKSYLRPERFVVVQQARLPVWGDPAAAPAPRRRRLRPAPAAARRAGRRALVGARRPRRSGCGQGLAAADSRAAAGAPASASATRRSAAPRCSSAPSGLLNTPYGWGGSGDKRDCSGLMMDLLGRLRPRDPAQHHAPGAGRHAPGRGRRPRRAGQGREPSRPRRGAACCCSTCPATSCSISAATARSSTPFICSRATSPRASPRGETMQRVNRTVVSSLELGRGGSRRAFIQRITPPHRLRRPGRARGALSDAALESP